MKIFKINPNSDFNEIAKFIKPDPYGQRYMKKKSSLNYIYMKELKTPGANILKQEALSVGAELVVKRETILAKGLTNALLMATDRQIEELAKKTALQDFELKKLSLFLKMKFKKPKKALIMGVVNINEDSFNQASRVDKNSAIAKIQKQIIDSASYIDIGGCSSRPNSIYPGRDEEFRRVKPVIDEIYSLKLYEKAKFSLDSFDEYCLEYALDRGFKMINDISAKLSLCDIAKKYDAEYLLMHMQNDPQTMQNNPTYKDLIYEIDSFFEEKLEQIAKFGIDKIYLDVGIGFGKSAQDNLFLIKHLEHFLRFGYPLLVGASRKSVINHYSPSKVEDRLAGSLYLHLKSFENGATIIRTHDVYEHAQLFKMHEALSKTTIW
ncbi:dihydropteroate synthase [uncultured Campylobacter sp.]|uniref:dihydropteroate synthase n=1 Tax=uncultured Campylobacter sp. TaxID=218934 RepID=UPI0026287898|nr:dihydropteroate synthase [uncultured Campylobacter sp.]